MAGGLWAALWGPVAAHLGGGDTPERHALRAAAMTVGALPARPTVSVVVPVRNEQAHIDACLDAVVAQTYEDVVEILVVDGSSTDATRVLAGRHPKVRVIDNPWHVQAVALNLALVQARGDVVVRVDGHCVIAPDYVERCVEALRTTGAAMVGGAMQPVVDPDAGWRQAGIARAMGSRFGAGPARFHRPGAGGWTDTVYLGAYRRRLALAAGGYAEDVGVNEDAEFALRLRELGGVWLDGRIRSTYVPRSRLGALARQFFRYGRSRAATVRRHPESLAPRQLLPPALVVALASPWRTNVAGVYAGVVLGRALVEVPGDRAEAAGFGLALPVMHLAWGTGFLVGLVSGPRPVARLPEGQLPVISDPDRVPA